MQAQHVTYGDAVVPWVHPPTQEFCHHWEGLLNLAGQLKTAHESSWVLGATASMSLLGLGRHFARFMLLYGFVAVTKCLFVRK